MDKIAKQDKAKYKCNYKKLCEYKSISGNYCNLNEDERADCCPMNLKPDKPYTSQDALRSCIKNNNEFDNENRKLKRAIQEKEKEISDLKELIEELYGWVKTLNDDKNESLSSADYILLYRKVKESLEK